MASQLYESNWDFTSDNEYDDEYDTYDYDYENNYDYDYEEDDEEWPNRNRFLRYPNLEFLKKSYVPPLEAPSPIPNEYIVEYKEHQEVIAKAESIKKIALEKSEKILEELKKAEEVPKTYTAAKWGAKSSRDALVQRLTNDYSAADEEYRMECKKVDELKEKKKSLGDWIDVNNSIIAFYTKAIAEQNKRNEEIYGKIEQITSHEYISLFYNVNVVKEDDDTTIYTFKDGSGALDRCVLSLSKGGVCYQRCDWDSIVIL